MATLAETQAANRLLRTKGTPVPGSVVRYTAADFDPTKTYEERVAARNVAQAKANFDLFGDEQYDAALGIDTRTEATKTRDAAMTDMGPAAPAGLPAYGQSNAIAASNALTALAPTASTTTAPTLPPSKTAAEIAADNAAWLVSPNNPGAKYHLPASSTPGKYAPSTDPWANYDPSKNRGSVLRW